jgi:hypothetical protein
MDYVAIAEDAKQALTEDGMSVTIRKVVVGEYDPSTGSASNTVTDTVKQGLILPFGRGQAFFNGKPIVTNDERLLLEPSAVFEVTDSVLIGGVEYNIVSASPFHPAGITCLHDLHIRRS